MKVSTKNLGTDIIHSFYLEKIITRKDAILWIANVALLNEICVSTITVEDFRSFHDGTKTKPIAPICSTEDFMKEYLNTDYEGVDIDASYGGIPFSLGINLSTFKIVLGYQSKYHLDCDKLEQLLGLV